MFVFYFFCSRLVNCGIVIQFFVNFVRKLFFFFFVGIGVYVLEGWVILWGGGPFD